MKCHVAVIGCGQLGRRHIQGLGISKSEIKVHIYDNSQDSIQTCKTFISDIAHEIRNLEIEFYETKEALGKAISFFNLVIISSTASDRPIHLKSLCNSINSKAWLLEKPICQSPDELDELIDLTKDMNIWVNHPWRFMPMHHDLKNNYLKDQEIDITFSGPNIGIGCNISHCIDLVNFFTDEIPKLVDTSGLSNKWHNSKRNGFKEIDGKLVCKFSKGSKMQVVSDNILNNFIISGTSLKTGKNFIIDNKKSTITFDEEFIQFSKIPLQSQLSGKVFDQINKYGYSDLTKFPIAAKCYRMIIGALLKHWQNTSGQKSDRFVPLS